MPAGDCVAGEAGAEAGAGVAGAEGEDARDVAEVEGVAGRDLDLLLERSTHGFSGGTRGTVYCATAGRDKSHRFGAHTPTSTRQAATRRFALV